MAFKKMPTYANKEARKAAAMIEDEAVDRRARERHEAKGRETVDGLMDCSTVHAQFNGYLRSEPGSDGAQTVSFALNVTGEGRIEASVEFRSWR